MSAIAIDLLPPLGLLLLILGAALYFGRQARS